MFLGEWGTALAAIDEAADLAAKNGHARRAHTLRLTRAWLSWHAQAPEPALIACKAALNDLAGMAAAAGVRVAHVLSGACHVLAKNYQTAADHLANAQRLMDTDPVCWDWFWRLQLDWAWTELRVALGDLGEARRAADRLLQSSLNAGEKTWQALGWNNAATVSLAEGSTARAERKSTRHCRLWRSGRFHCRAGVCWPRRRISVQRTETPHGRRSCARHLTTPSTS
jgi:tetratricopeptide (TPR) repeat protein